MTDRRPTQYAAGSLAASAFVAALRRVARRVRTLPDRPARLDKAFKSELRSRTTARGSGAGHGAPVGHRLARARRYQRSRLVIHLDQGVNCLSGPLSVAKLRVLSAWIPALWSPLKRVTVLGQPAA